MVNDRATIRVTEFDAGTRELFSAAGLVVGTRT
jgi:hypothetical protein